MMYIFSTCSSSATCYFIIHDVHLHITYFTVCVYYILFTGVNNIIYIYGSTRCIYHHKINSYVINNILVKDELITVVVNTIIKKIMCSKYLGVCSRYVGVAVRRYF